VRPPRGAALAMPEPLGHAGGMPQRVERRLGLALALVLGVTLAGRLLGYGFGRSTVVRCRKGHLFTTIWVPGVKLKAVDLLVARLQRCPVGPHWSLVMPVRAATLTEEELSAAKAHRDVRIP
jgi:hypothetical protein